MDQIQSSMDEIGLFAINIIWGKSTSDPCWYSKILPPMLIPLFSYLPWHWWALYMPIYLGILVQHDIPFILWISAYV